MVANTLNTIQEKIEAQHSAGVDAARARLLGGKDTDGGRVRATEEDKDFIEHLFTASTHDYLMFFTNLGRAYV